MTTATTSPAGARAAALALTAVTFTGLAVLTPAAAHAAPMPVGCGFIKGDQVLRVVDEAGNNGVEGFPLTVAWHDAGRSVNGLQFKDNAAAVGVPDEQFLHLEDAYYWLDEVQSYGTHREEILVTDASGEILLEPILESWCVTVVDDLEARVQNPTLSVTLPVGRTDRHIGDLTAGSTLNFQLPMGLEPTAGFNSAGELPALEVPVISCGEVERRAANDEMYEGVLRACEAPAVLEPEDDVVEPDTSSAAREDDADDSDDGWVPRDEPASSNNILDTVKGLYEEYAKPALIPFPALLSASALILGGGVLGSLSAAGRNVFRRR